MPSSISFDGASKLNGQLLSMRKRINFAQPRTNSPRKIWNISFWAWKGNV